MLHKIIEKRDLSPSAYALRLERNQFVFRPGQCVNLGLPGSGVNREYSTYSGTDDPYLEFLIKEVPVGTVSSALRKLEGGMEVELHGPYGSFVLQPEKIGNARFVFIGTGTGIAPFHSFVRSYPGLDYRLICGIRESNERYDAGDYDPERTVFCVSRENWEGYNGRVTDYLLENEVDPACIYYLCGNQKMIYSVYEILRNREVNGDRIFTEAFF
ncbi:MAG: oxidoreductase [Nitrospinae bacterium CG11_big_fil_rev_8_21_14_0_20_56_8]|nr:MAG: oxidoreductase [Nitrospinae bacterium CG11_big_fil_rev_8_21_14_0_20_56_8]